MGIGLVMIYSASSALAMKRHSSDFFFIKKQLLYALLGIGALMVCRYIPYQIFSHMAYPMLLISIILLIAVKITPFGDSAGGATRWLKFGAFKFQPSEFARFALIVYLSYSMTKKKDKLKDFWIGFFPHVIVLGFLLALIYIQPDYGTLVIMMAITWIMMFVGGVKIIHLSSAFIIALPALIFLMFQAQYRIKRITSFLDPWQDPAGQGYQAIHSLMAFGTGGLFGTGIGRGYQKLFYLPEPHTDFIFSVIGEELGLLGVMLIVGLYALIIWRGINIAKYAKDSFGSYLAIGLTASLGIQVCINMGVTLGLLPTKGLTLPFLSYGGTSLLINMAAIGVLLNIGASRDFNEE
ncbi:MAG: putative lipid II flippase FtsW [Desulfobacterales bacterium]|nr:putative lipid II flippase FtsW [Desulfobacterales bacterium]MBF0396050.1 putative lipid II flippase FtsW [Desulfobacterales bacterium]